VFDGGLLRATLPSQRKQNRDRKGAGARHTAPVLAAGAK